MSETRGRPRQYSDEELLEWIREMADDGEPPKRAEIDEVGGPYVSTFRYRFGSWADAVRAAGFEPREPSRGGGPKYSEEELLDWIRTLADGDSPPAISDMESSDGPSPSTYSPRFGTWADAVRAAGFEPREPGDNTNRKYSDEELLEWIRAFVCEFGVSPTAADIKAWPGPSQMVYRLQFGSCTNAIKEAGFEPRGSSDGATVSQEVER